MQMKYTLESPKRIEARLYRTPADVMPIILAMLTVAARVAPAGSIGTA